MEAAAREAGKLIRAHFGKAEETAKGDATAVTKIDSEAEKLIIERLAPFGYGVVGEETGTTHTGTFQWFIDPIDGTSNFARGLPLCCVSIGLVQDGEPIAAIVYDPINDRLYSAERGKGFSTGFPLPVQDRTKTMLCFDDWHSKNSAEFHSLLARLLVQHPVSSRSIGSAALALAWVAAGQADAFFGFGQEPYDIAAGLLLCREAGVKLTDWGGVPRGLEAPTTLAAREPLHAELLEILSNAAE